MRSRGFTVAALTAAAAAVTGAYLLSQNSMALAAVRARAAASGSHAGRRAVVVGGTSGIGEGTAMALARAGFSVTVVGRSAERGASVTTALNELGGGPHRFIAADASSLASAYRFADDLARDSPSLDVLVLTPGIATVQGYTPTAEGIDQKLAVHYYGRVAFVDALLPLLRRGASPKVLTVLSAGVHGVYSEYASDPLLERNYGLKNAADAAGLYNDVAMDSFSRDPANAGIKFIHAAPGFVSTNWGREMPTIIRWLVRAIQPFGRSLSDCGEFMAAPLLERDGGGFLLVDPDARPTVPTPVHEVAREPVWAHTQEILARFRPRATVVAATATEPSPAAAAGGGGGGGGGGGAAEVGGVDVVPAASSAGAVTASAPTAAAEAGGAPSGTEADRA